MIIDFIKGNGGGGSGSGYTLPTATATRLGGVKIGEGINVQNDGTISVSGGSADLSAYWTSAETKSYVDTEVSGVTPDMSAYWTSAETKSYVDEATSGVTPSGDVTILKSNSEIPSGVSLGDVFSVAEVVTSGGAGGWQVITNPDDFPATTQVRATRFDVDQLICFWYDQGNYVGFELWAGDEEATPHVENADPDPVVPNRWIMSDPDGEVGYIDYTIDGLIGVITRNGFVWEKVEDVYEAGIQFEYYGSGEPTSSVTTTLYIQTEDGPQEIGAPDMSAYWTSGETQTYVDDEISGITEDLSVLDGRVTDIEDTMAKSYGFELSTVNPEDFTAQDIGVLNDFFEAVSGDTSLAEVAYFNGGGYIFRLSNYAINGDAGSFVFCASDFEYLQSVELNFELGEYAEGYYYDNDLSGKEQVISRAINDLKDTKVESTDVLRIVKITQSDYDDLVLDDEVDPDTLYIIINNN